jgi:S1-C subfamily serine protease
VIVAVDEMGIPSLTVLQNEMRLRRPGDDLTITIMRDGERIDKRLIVERGW